MESNTQTMKTKKVIVQDVSREDASQDFLKKQNYNVSASIIFNDPLFKRTDLDYDDVLLAVLYKFGFDIEEDISVDVCTHRNHFGEVVTCQLFMGAERNDDRWKKLKYYRLHNNHMPHKYH